MGVFKQHFDHSILSKYTFAFGTLFTDMVLVRKNPDGSEFERYTIPFTYAPKEKYIQRTQSDPNLTRPANITLPRMSFELVGLQYDESRNLNNKQLMSFFKSADPNNRLAYYSPAPYNMSFQVYITTKTTTEMLQIIEQILPAFKPDYRISIKLHNGYDDHIIDVPITLLNEFGQDTYDGEIQDDRTIIWTLSFLVKGYLFGPFNDKPVIKQVEFTEHPISQVNVTPDTDKVKYSQVTFTVVVAGKTLEEIYETDDWSIETVFG